MLAAERFGHLLLDAVQFLVFGQPAVGRVGFAAVGTLVARRGRCRSAADAADAADAGNGRFLGRCYDVDGRRRIGTERTAATGRRRGEVFDVTAIGKLTGADDRDGGTG